MSDNQNQVDEGQSDPDTTASLNGASAIAYGAIGDVGAPNGSDGSVFLADLAHAMQATAGAQRVRVAEAAEERRQSHIDSIRGREAAQTEEYRELAERDIKGVEAWATGEIERIRLERQRDRGSEERARASPAAPRHDRASRSRRPSWRTGDEVDTFFGRLDSESDPIAIARQAGGLPPFPALELIGPDDSQSVAADDSLASLVQPINDEAIAQHDETIDHQDEPPADGDGTTGADAGSEGSEDAVAAVAEDAVAEGTEEAPLIGVMDPEPVPAAVTPWDRHGGEEADTVEGDAGVAVPGSYLPPDDDQLIGDTDPEAVGSGVTKITARSSGAVIQPAASSKPIGSWLRRSNHPS
jgi:hypothetical protein